MMKTSENSLSRALLAIPKVEHVNIITGYGWFETIIKGGDPEQISHIIANHLCVGIETRGIHEHEISRISFTEELFTMTVRFSRPGLRRWIYALGYRFTDWLRRKF